MEVVDKRKNKIAHVITESGPFGGAQRNTLLTLKGLMRDGYDAELVCGPGGPLIQEARAIHVPVHVIPHLIRYIDPIKDTCSLFHLYRLFRSRGYRIVHTHSTKAGLLGRVAAWLGRIPVIIHTIHGVPFQIGDNLHSRSYIALERLLGHLTNRMVCVGEVLRQEVSAWKMAPDEKLVTIYSGIDFSSYAPTHTPPETKRKLEMEGYWPIVGCIGRLSEQKAQDYLVEAVALLKCKYRRIHLLLVGEGSLRSRLEKQIADLRLVSNVSLLGERDDVADLLSIFDIYCMASRWEGVGRALTEAMHVGLPVVATPVNGVVELISHEETGLIVPVENPGALADAIDRLASDRDLAERLGTNARRRAEGLMDSRQMVIAIEKLYERLIAPWAITPNGSVCPE
jgi:glycosyltransferase involved in cell wall biosynthesis